MPAVNYEFAVTRLDFGGAMTARAIDTVLIQDYVSDRPVGITSAYEFDFRDTIFIEPCALQSVIAFLRTLLSQGKAISFRVPKDKRVRDFWRAWHFAEALETATGKSLRELTQKQDHVYFGEKQEFFLGAEIDEAPGSPRQRLAFFNHFPLYSAPVDRKKRPAELAYAFKSKWNALHVQDILKRKIGKNYGYFASRVVFEAILNSIRHPGASLIQTGAIDQAASLRSKIDSYLNVHFWDNGRSIADTLYTAIQRGVRVREGAESEYARNYLLRYTPELSGPSFDSLVPSDVELTANVPQHVALLATVFPLVTSDPVGKDHEADIDLRQSDPRLARRGMGLFVLINTVVEVMNGEAGFRTSNFFMNVRKPNKDELKAHPTASLTVNMKRFPSTSAQYTGNMLIARIPIIEKDD